jgi:MFS family permease
MPTIYIAAFLIGAGEVLVDNALQSLVPRVVARDDLERANSMLIAAETAGNELVGPPVGAFLFAAVPAAPFLIDAASYGYSASAAHRLSGHVPRERRARVPLRRITGEVVDGLRWLRSHSYLRAITVWGGVFNIGSTASFSVLVLFALEILDTGDVGYGVLLSVVAVGGLVGAAVASPLARRVGRGRTILLGAAGSGVVVSIVGLIDNTYGAAALLFASSGLGAMVNVVGRALRQAMVPDLMRGRVTASNRLIVYGAMPLGAALGGWIARTFGLRAAFIVGGVIMTAVSLAIAPWLRERLIDDALSTHE